MFTIIFLICYNKSNKSQEGGISMRVKSNAISNVKYDVESQRLSITFRHGGRTYDYYDVNKRTYDRLMNAESKGVFVNKWITPLHDYLPR
jgi:hypothetical protein